MTCMFNKTVFFIIALFCFLASICSAATPQPPDQPGKRVVDLAGIMDQNSRLSLESYLAQIEKATTAQIVVLTLNSLDGEDIEGFSIRTAERWKLGVKGKDNGILITVAVKDRKYRIEVGYGLEQIIPDSLAGTIGRTYFVPEFRQGRYSAGIIKAVHEIGSRIAKSHGVEVKNIPENFKRSKQEKPSLLKMIFMGAIAIGVLILFILNPQLFLMTLLLLSSGRGGGGWSSGGGFGSSGGFSGGGGSFGGGGASGSW